MRLWARNLLLFLACLPWVSYAGAQSLPTATQLMQLSVFGGFTGADVGLGGSRNLGATAGVDLAIGRYFGFQPALEIRGTDATSGRVVASQKSALVGGRVSRTYGRIQPYFDALFGRGILDYGLGGYPNPTFTLLYTHTAGNVLSGGGGVNLAVTEHFGAKIDYQYQRFAAPVTASKHVTSTPLTFGVVYLFDFNKHAKIDKRMR
jgi:opacity protein-like surface antigen